MRKRKEIEQAHMNGYGGATSITDLLLDIREILLDNRELLERHHNEMEVVAKTLLSRGDKQRRE